MDGEEVTLLANLSDRERKILLDGGILRQLREEQKDATAVGEHEPESAEERDAGNHPNPEVQRG